jgi:pimeloyl-ACP methyl ester carboxylesterase
MTDLHSVRYGDGERIYVGLHGWNGGTGIFAPLEPYLPSDVSIVAFGLPGYGDSPSPPEWSLEAVARQIVDGLDARGIDDFSVLGNCSGAIIGLYVARRARPRVEDFVLVEPFAWVPSYLSIFLTPVVGRLFYWSAFGNPIGRAITNRALAGQRQPSTDLLAPFKRSPLWVPMRYLTLFDQAGEATDYADVPGRKRILRGDRTFQAVRDSVEAWRSTWPETTYRKVEGAGHLLLKEAPEEAAEFIFDR